MGRGLKGVYSLVAAPPRVSLLTTRAWTYGSQPVGPATSVRGTRSYTRPGLNASRKARVHAMRSARDWMTSLLAFFCSKLSSRKEKKIRAEWGGVGVWFFFFSHLVGVG